MILVPPAKHGTRSVGWAGFSTGFEPVHGIIGESVLSVDG